MATIFYVEKPGIKSKTKIQKGIAPGLTGIRINHRQAGNCNFLSRIRTLCRKSESQDTGTEPCKNIRCVITWFYA